MFGPYEDDCEEEPIIPSPTTEDLTIVVLLMTGVVFALGFCVGLLF